MMIEFVRKKKFANGVVYALKAEDGYLIETTDTFLPFYTKDAIGQNQNALKDCQLGDRTERWLIGVSVMSGCPVRCKFCATGQLKKWRNLTATEICEQIDYVIGKNKGRMFTLAKEHKINYTRMGEPFLNIDNVKEAIGMIDKTFSGTHHYVSTIGVKDADYSWIKDNITLQISVHALQDKRRNWIIPYKDKATLEELGQIRTNSNLKTTVNLTLIEEDDFDIESLKEFFDPEFFFIKVSPINENETSKKNNMGKGVIDQVNLV